VQAAAGSTSAVNKGNRHCIQGLRRRVFDGETLSRLPRHNVTIKVSRSFGKWSHPAIWTCAEPRLTHCWTRTAPQRTRADGVI